MIAVISSSAPAFLLVLVPVLLIYRRVQMYYLATSRELKRLDATTKSPIFASFQETLGGVSTIRAYRQSQRFIAENEARLDRNQEAFFPSINCELDRSPRIRDARSLTCRFLSQATDGSRSASNSSVPSSFSRLLSLP